MICFSVDNRENQLVEHLIRWKETYELSFRLAEVIYTLQNNLFYIGHFESSLVEIKKYKLTFARIVRIYFLEN